MRLYWTCEDGERDEVRNGLSLRFEERDDDSLICDGNFILERNGRIVLGIAESMSDLESKRPQHSVRDRF